MAGNVTCGERELLSLPPMFHVVTSKKRKSVPRFPRSSAAFTLIEVLVAMMLSVMALTAFYASSAQAIRIVKSGKETALACQLLQERIEAMRSAPLWTSVTTPAGLSTILSSATLTAANFCGTTETVTVASYPAGGASVVVTRTPGGNIVSIGSSLAAQKCVKVTIQASWTGVGNTGRSRQIATLLVKGGL